MNSNNQRTYFFDNYKALLIIAVIVGHFIEPCYENNLLLTGLKWVIFSFHMPAFIFISGYFSKKKSSIEKLVQKLVIPYFVYELLYYFLYVYVIHKDTGLYLTRPKFSLWYIMALFFWRLATPYFQKIPGHFYVAITAGLLVGLTNIDNFLSIPRALFFYPFFLAGYHFKLEWFARIRQNTRKWFSALFVVLTGFLSIPVLCDISLTPKIFYGRYSYADMGTTDEIGILIRLACYLLSFLIIFALCCIVSEKQTKWAILGVRTMPIYLFHGLIYSVLKATPLLASVNTLTESLLLIGACIGLAFLLATELPNRFVTWVSSAEIHFNFPTGNSPHGMRNFPTIFGLKKMKS